jgi:hypothetical protein
MDALVLANHNESTRNLRLYLLSVFYLAHLPQLAVDNQQNSVNECGKAERFQAMLSENQM